jgi:hypothetical protein
MVEEEQKKFERINTIIHENSQEASYYVAQEIISLVTQRQKEGKKMVLRPWLQGLPLLKSMITWFKHTKNKG